MICIYIYTYIRMDIYIYSSSHECFTIFKVVSVSVCWLRDIKKVQHQIEHVCFFSKPRFAEML